MGLFTTLSNLFRAKKEEAAEAIEDANRTSFADQAVRDIGIELGKARENHAKMEATHRGIARNIAKRKEELETRTTQAKELKAVGNTELALQVAQQVLKIREEIEDMETQLTQIASLRDQQKSNIEELTAAHAEAVRDVQTMKATAQITESTRALSSVDGEGVESALSKLAKYKDRQAADLDLAQARVNAKNEGNLDSKVEAALGGRSAAAQSLLDTL